MFLKRLDIQGFKSFPQRIRVDFGPGITSVVGPRRAGWMSSGPFSGKPSTAAAVSAGASTRIGSGDADTSPGARRIAMSLWWSNQIA